MTTLLRQTSTLHSINKLRNIGIAAHIDAGKTTLTERVLFFTGAIHRCGDVHEGNTTTDFSPLERKKGITISAAAAPCSWTPVPEKGRTKLLAGLDHRLNLIDTPGHVDFTAEVERSLRVLDGAIAVFCGVAGVQPQSETVWRQANKYRVPRIAFINKMDRVGADFDRVVRQLNELLRTNAWPVVAPLGAEENLTGQLDVINGRVLMFEQGKNGLYRIETPSGENAERLKLLREELVSRLAELDETIASLWLEERPVPSEVLLAAIRRQTIANRFVPVLGGSAYRYIGVQPLIDAVVQFLPSPSDVPWSSAETCDLGTANRVQADPDKPVVALAFKLVNDKQHGRLTYLRLYQGTLSKGVSLLNPRTGRLERIGRLVRVLADRREELESASAGEICAVVGLKEFATGDTLCDPDHIVALEPPSFPEPVVSMALEAAEGVEQEQLANALAKVSEEDPTFLSYTHPDTGQCIVAGMGELHLEVIREKLATEQAVPTQAGAPAIAYRETVTGNAEADYLLKKQHGGTGMYARVKLAVEPAPRGSGVSIENRISGGAIPTQFLGAVHRGIQEAIQSGGPVGYALTDLRVSILDGAAHAKDSNELAFRIASVEALRQAVARAEPALLEPWMQVECTVPVDHHGEIVGDLLRRRALIGGLDNVHGYSVVKAEAPLSELFGYTNAIRSLSRGRASSTMSPCRFDIVPAALVAEIQAARAS